MDISTSKVRPTLYNMEIGQVLVFGIEKMKKMKNIRTTCSELGAIYQRKYSTHVVRENRTIEVKRVN